MWTHVSSVFSKRVPIAHDSLGNAYLKKGNLDKAVSEYKKSLALNPRFAKAHYTLGLAYYYRRDYKLAVIHCDRAIALGGDVDPKL